MRRSLICLAGLGLLLTTASFAAEKPAGKVEKNQKKTTRELPPKEKSKSSSAKEHKY